MRTSRLDIALKEKGSEDQALELHRRSIFIDMLNPSRVDRNYLLKIKKGLITATNITVAGISNGGLAHLTNSPPEAIAAVAKFKRLIEENSDIAMLVKSTKDIEKAKGKGKVGLIMGFQNTLPIGDNLDLLEVYHEMGVRIIQLTYNERNLCGDGCTEPSNSGLSGFGKEVIRKMNELGIMIDLSHVGDNTCADTIKYSKKPPAVTHANARAVCESPRNKPDSLIKAIAKRDSLTGLVIFPPFISEKLNSTLKDLMVHADYVKKLVGLKHLGFGSDFTEGWTYDELMAFKKFPLKLPDKIIYPVELDTVSKAPNFTRVLVAHGYSEYEVQGILGLNFMRVFGRNVD